MTLALTSPEAQMAPDGARLLLVDDHLLLVETLQMSLIHPGFTSEANGVRSILDQVERAAAGETVTPVTVRAQLLADLDAHRRAADRRKAPFEALSARERDVLRQIVEGHQAAAIAKASFVSLATVRTQIRSILLKLDVTSQVAAVAMARQGGWFDTVAEEAAR